MNNKRKIQRICIVGASGKLGQYLVNQALSEGRQVVGVCREQSVNKLAHVADRIEIVPGNTDDREVIARAVTGCDAVLTVLAPWGMHHYASGTAQAVLDFAEPGARLIFSCGWHINKAQCLGIKNIDAAEARDQYSWQFRCFAAVFGLVAAVLRIADLNDQVEACRRIIQSNSLWTIVRGSDLEEGASQGLPVWREYVGDPALASNITRRVDFALFMLHAVDDDGLVHKLPAICGCTAESVKAVSAKAALANEGG